jgi:hypothetical protein
MTLYISEHHGLVSYVYGSLHVVEVSAGEYYIYRNCLYSDIILRSVWLS